MKIKKLVAGLLAGTMMLTATCFAERQARLGLSLSPGIMNDQTGEIVTAVKVSNTEAVLAQDGRITSFEFECRYDNEIFNVAKNDDGTLKITSDDNSLVKADNVTATEENGKLHIICKDFSGINSDGTIFSFTMVAKNVSKLWNSFDEYPLSFVENSISVKAADGETEKTCLAEGFDRMVGAYNTDESFAEAITDRRIVFSLNKNIVRVNGNEKEIDAIPYEKDGEYMIPMRYLAESTDMEVAWDAQSAMACAYGKNKTLKVSLKDNKAYVNSLLCVQSENPLETDGRTYLPSSIVQEIYPNASVNVLGNEIIIYIK